MSGVRFGRAMLVSMLAATLAWADGSPRDGGFTILGDYILGAGATLSIENASLRVGGDVDIAINDYARFDLSAATLQLIGLPGQGPQNVELLAEDMGNCGITLPDTARWSINRFRVGPTATSAVLVDNHDNDQSGGGAETFYVNELVLDPGITLDLNGFNLYYLTITPEDPYLMGSGVTVIDNGGALIQLVSSTPDCNNNGVGDQCDIDNGTSQDCNASNIPDECEQDCNSNGYHDSCDIAGPTSDDCNANTIPDSCDINGGASQDCDGSTIPDECELDCNSNGYHDSCDLTGGTSFDCNTNNTPDDCDINGGPSLDVNTNGIPDECEVQTRIVLTFGNNARAAEDCIQPGSGTNETLIVDVRMEALTTTIVGGQFFMTYDTAFLQFLTAVPGDPPFDQEIFEDVDNPSPGQITYLVGIENNGTGTSADTTMARLYFQVTNEDCASTSMVRLLEFDPFTNVIPTRLADDDNNPVYGTLVDLAEITFDGQIPLVTGTSVFGGVTDATCQFTVTFSSFVVDNCGIQTNDITVDVTLPTTNALLGPPTVTMVQVDSFTVSITGSVLVSAVENCPATVQVFVEATDDCGNIGNETASGDVNDTTLPVVDALEVTGGNTDGACEYTVTFTATVTDNCFLDADDVVANVSLTTGNASIGTATISYIQTDAQTVDITGSVLVSAVENCPATIEVTVDATDDCSNSAIQGVDSADVNDATAPVVTAIDSVGGDLDGNCEFTVNFTATIVDNCFLDTADVVVDVTLPSGNATLGTPVFTVTQTDPQTADVVGSVLVSAVENCPATVQVTVDASDDCGNDATQAFTSADVNDISQPVVTAIDSIPGSVDGNCEFTVTFSATIEDNCFLDTSDVLVLVTLPTGNATLGTPNIILTQTNPQTVDVNGSVLVSGVEDCPATVQVTVDASDDCSNDATQGVTSADVNDITEPVISGLALTGGVVDSNCEFTLTFSATVTDNCFQDTSDVTVSAIISGGAATLGSPIYTVSVVDPQTVEVTGSVLLSAISDCPATVEVTIDANDDCTNATSDTDTAEVTDDVSPVTTAPADITVHSDAGTCEADLTTTGFATAVDNCIAGTTITFSRSDGKPNLLDPYEAADSPITITWTAEDDCGNTGTDTQVITVSDQNEITVDVELSPTIDDTNGPFAGGTLTRCITFNLWQCPTDMAPTDTVAQEVTFPTDAPFPARALNVPVLVDCGYAYTCMTARDRLHTLRSTAPDFTDTGTTYSATFIGNRATGGHSLLGGNLNDDQFIDILDFGSFVIQFQNFFGTGDTTCATPFFHPDISGDGLVFTGDFTFIQVNILKFHEANCCGRPGIVDDGSDSRRAFPQGAIESIDEPIMSISVSDLYRHGMGELAGADLNGDSVLDVADMQIFTQNQGLPPVVIPNMVDGKVSPVQDGSLKRSSR